MRTLAFDEADAENTIKWIGASVFDPTCESLRVKLLRRYST
jgi:hypothetical protein